MRFLLVLCVLVLVACHPAPQGPPPSCARAWAPVPQAAGLSRRLSRTGCHKRWTVFVHMLADAADLAAPADRDLRSIEDPASHAGSTEQADVVVELDRGRDGILRLHLFRASVAGPVQSPVVEVLDKSSGPPEERLERFLTWGLERYPSDHYAVVVWGHGLGFRPPGSGARPADGATVLGSGPAGTSGIFRALTAAAHDRPFDLYASDACLMQSVEVAGELVGAARYVVGSEAIEEDYVGLPYRSWLPLLNGTAPLPAAAACAPADVVCHAAAALPALGVAEGAPGYTLSTVDEASLAYELLPALRRLGSALIDYAREDDLRRVSLQVLLGPAHGPSRGTPSFRGGARDIGVFLERLEALVHREPGPRGTPAVKGLLAATAAARAALRRTVVAASFGQRYQGAGFEAMAGLSMWLPHDEVELRANAAFFAPSVLFHESPSFGAFLDQVFAPPKR